MSTPVWKWSQLPRAGSAQNPVQPNGWVILPLVGQIHVWPPSWATAGAATGRHVSRASRPAVTERRKVLRTGAEILRHRAGRTPTQAAKAVDSGGKGGHERGEDEHRTEWDERLERQPARDDEHDEHDGEPDAGDQ